MEIPTASIRRHGFPIWRATSLFANAGERKIYGEATPFYIHASYVADEISRFNPQAKIMAILRNPVERACSMYHYFHQHDRRADISPEDFRRKFFDGSIAHVPVSHAIMQMEHLRSSAFTTGCSNLITIISIALAFWFSIMMT